MKFCGERLQLRNNIRSFWIKIAVPILHVRQAGLSDPFAVFKRAQVLNVQFHRKE